MHYSCINDRHSYTVWCVIHVSCNVYITWSIHNLFFFNDRTTSYSRALNVAVAARAILLFIYIIGNCNAEANVDRIFMTTNWIWFHSKMLYDTMLDYEAQWENFISYFLRYILYIYYICICMDNVICFTYYFIKSPCTLIAEEW